MAVPLIATPSVGLPDARRAVEDSVDGPANEPVGRVLLVGHVCLDDLGRGEPALGGTVWFAAAEALHLGWAVSIRTACTPATEARLLAALDGRVRVSNAGSPVDTTFLFRGGLESGPSTTVTVADTIADLGADEDFDLVHLGPIADELGPATVAAALDGPAFVGLTPQGAMRVLGAGRDLSLHDLPLDRRYQEVDAMVVNEREHEVLAGGAFLGRFGGLAFVTHGSAGATVRRAGVEVGRHAPTVSGLAPLHRDIGAGDVFALTAFTALSTGADSQAAVARAVEGAAAFVHRPEAGLLAPRNAVRPDPEASR